jgi:hypothetical protein
MNLLYRDYNPGFTCFHGKGLFSSSSGDNVRGMFGNFTYEAARHLFVIAGCDLRYYPWLKYRCSAPSMAIGREVRIKFLPSDKITIEAVNKYCVSMLNDQEASGIDKQENIFSRLIKGTVKYSPDDNLTLGIRLDYKSAEPGMARGMLLLQDLNYRFSKIPVSVWLRYCIFRTDNWDSRLYAYENDLLYSFSIPALSGEGSRSYIMIAWKASEFIDFRIKYGLTDLIPEDDAVKETQEFKMQLRMRF